MASPASGQRGLPRFADRRAAVSGAVLIGLALVITFLLDTPWDSVSTFRISRPRDVWAVGNLTVPSQWFNVAASVLLAFLGARLFRRGAAAGRHWRLASGLSCWPWRFLSGRRPARPFR